MRTESQNIMVKKLQSASGPAGKHKIPVMKRPSAKDQITVKTLKSASGPAESAPDKRDCISTKAIKSLLGRMSPSQVAILKNNLKNCKEIPVTSGCTGSNIAGVYMMNLTKVLKVGKFDELCQAEKVPNKQKFLSFLGAKYLDCPHTCLFEDTASLACADGGACLVHKDLKAKCQVQAKT